MGIDPQTTVRGNQKQSIFSKKNLCLQGCQKNEGGYQFVPLAYPETIQWGNDVDGNLQIKMYAVDSQNVNR